KAAADWIGNLGKHDRNRAGELLQFRQRRIGRRYDYIWRQTDHFCRSGLYSVDVTAPPTILDAQVAAVDPAQPLQRVEERRDASLTFAIGLRVGPYQYGDPSNSIHWLRPCLERPRSRAAKQRDERAPPDHSITSSARCWRIQGTSRPSALAVLRLIPA